MCRVRRRLPGLRGRAGGPGQVAPRALGAPGPAAALPQLAGNQWIAKAPASCKRAAPCRCGGSHLLGFPPAAAGDVLFGCCVALVPRQRKRLPCMRAALLRSREDKTSRAGNRLMRTRPVLTERAKCSSQAGEGSGPPAVLDRLVAPAAATAGAGRRPPIPSRWFQDPSRVVSLQSHQPPEVKCSLPAGHP